MVNNMNKCYNCNLSHIIYKCPSFLALPVPDRINKVNALKLRKTCLRPHNDKKSFGKKCFNFHKDHNTMLNLNSSKDGEENKNNTMTTDNDNSNASRSDNENIPVIVHITVTATEAALYKYVMISTTIIKVYNE